MKRFVVLLLAASAIAIGTAQAQAPGNSFLFDGLLKRPVAAVATQSAVERLDPALDALVDANTKVEIIHQDDQFFEGPDVSAFGCLNQHHFIADWFT